MYSVRTERPADVAAVHSVIAASFPSDAEARLVDRLREAGRLPISLVAEVGDEIVGHIAFSPVTVRGDSSGIGLAPLAVLAAYRRRGIGSALVRAGLDHCRAGGFRWCVVLGEPAYYGRFGFRAAAEFGLVDRYGGGAAFQVLELVPQSLPAGAGLVEYAPEFDAFG